MIIKNTFIAVVFAVLSLNTSFIHAQDGEIFLSSLNGSSCFNECSILEFYAQDYPLENPLQASWTIFDNTYTLLNTDTFAICQHYGPMPDGLHPVQVNAIFADGTTVQLQDSIYFNPNITNDWSSNGNDICISNSHLDINQDSTLMILNVEETYCVGTSVRYCFADFPWNNDILTDISFGIEGATSYHIDPEQPDCIIVNWDNIGIGSISFTNWCSSFITTTVNILPLPSASVTSNIPIINDTLTVCQGQTIDFINQSLDADHYLWDFGFTTSSDENPSIIFDTSGTFDINLLATNICDCSDQTNMTVVVISGATTNLDCVSTVCTGEEITYSTDSDCETYTWEVSPNGHIINGGNNSDDFITIEWLNGIEGEITLTIDNCQEDACQIPYQVNIPIISDNVPIFGDNQVCNHTEETYSLPDYDGTSFEWQVSESGTIISGQNTNEITVRWSISDNQLPSDEFVNVAYDNCFLDCGGYSNLIVKILPQHYANGPLEVCQNSNEIYEAFHTSTHQPIPAIWTITKAGNTLWTSSTPQLSPSIEWNYPPGYYQLSAQPIPMTSFCTESFSLNILVTPTPGLTTTIVGEDSICVGNTYLYQAESITPNTQFDWGIINGLDTVVQSGNTIIVEWGAIPPYEIHLIESLTTGGSTCQSPPISLIVHPISSIEIQGSTHACLEQISTYTATDIIGVDHQWSITPPEAGTIIGSTNSDTLRVLWHQIGTHQLSTSTCLLNANTTIQVHDITTPIINAPPALCGEETTIVSVTPNFEHYNWFNTSGVEISNLSTPELPAGTFQLMTTDQYGCKSDTTLTIAHLPTSPISISTPDPQIQSAPFSATLYALEAFPPYDYEWFLNGNSIGLNGQSSIAINQIGTYHVIATSANGCTQTSNNLSFDLGIESGNSSIGDPDCTGNEISFISQNTSQCDTLTFIATTTAPNDIHWDFGDGTSVQGGNTIGHNYTQAGYYRVEAFVNNNDISCGSYAIISVPMAAHFTFSNACLGESIQFTDISTYLPTTNITSWEWDFGDGTTTNTQHPTHTYNTDSQYTVSLTITADSGCTSVFKQTITPHPNPPTTNIHPLITCATSATLFEIDSISSTTSILWNFGDPSSTQNTSTISPTYHLYHTIGTYPISLTMNNIWGCELTLEDTITIANESLSGSISPAIPTTFCEGDSLLLQAPAGGVYWIWSTGETTESIYAKTAGLYEVTVINPQGCDYTTPFVIVNTLNSPNNTPRVVEYDNFGNPTTYYYDEYEICYGEDVTIEVIGDTSLPTIWSTGETSTTISFTAEKDNLLPVGTTDINVSITDSLSGCTAISTIRIIVHDLPQDVSISQPGNITYCEGNTAFFFVDNPNSDYTYTWNSGQTTPQIFTTIAGEYFVSATNEFGCTTTSNSLEVLHGPNIKQLPSGCHEVCAPDTICFPLLEGVTDFQWFFEGNAIQAPQGNWAYLPVQESGEYYVQMENEAGCTLTSDPLTLSVVDGYGHILGGVYVDVDNSGDISLPDTLLSGIGIHYTSPEGDNTTTTTDNGTYIFEDIPDTDYILTLDQSSLPTLATPLWTQIDTSIIGCDVEITANWLITFECLLTTNINLQICQGESITYNDITYDTAGTYTQHFTTAEDCDSTVIIAIEEYSPIIHTLEWSTCPNEPIYYEGDTLLAGQQAVYNYIASNGCDSILQIDIQALPHHEENIPISSCYGENIIYNGMVIPPDTTVSLSYTNEWGCDSTLLVTHIEQNLITTDLQLEICEGEQTTYQNTLFEDGDERTFVFTAENGCDSIVYVSAIAFPPILFDYEAPAICQNANNGQIIITAEGGAGNYNYQFNGGPPTSNNVFTNLPVGNYPFTITDQQGCSISSSIALQALPPLHYEIQASDFSCQDLEAELSISLQSASDEHLQILWSNGDTSLQTTVFSPGHYSAIVSNNCEEKSSAIEVVRHTSINQKQVFIPNAFSPNGDGVNDIFKPFFHHDVIVEKMHLTVYNRWGGKVFETEDYNQGWNGNQYTDKNDVNVFVWTLTATINVCGEVISIEKAGDVTLLRW